MGALPAIYARVSTEEQSVQQQLDRLRAVAPGAIEYVDESVSGRLSSRPAFDRLITDLIAGRVDETYVVKLDRLGRSASSILEFFRLAEQAGARIVVIDQQIDTSTPVGRMVRTVLAAMAELEADLIRERTREAMAALKAGTRATASGRPVGRPRKVTPEIEARIRELRAAGTRWAEIARRVHLPSGTCRKVPAERGKLPRVENPPAGFGTPAVDPRPVSTVAKRPKGGG